MGWREQLLPVGDVRLHVVEAGPEQGPPIMLLHGFPEFWWAWRLQLKELAAAGYRVIAPDMRGYGGSDVPAGIKSYDMGRLVEDVANLARALGLTRFSLVGHDWGGLVAWHFAARQAQMLQRLVIMDAPHPDVWRPFALRHPTQALRSAYMAWFQIPLLPEKILGARDCAMLRQTMTTTANAGTFPPEVLDRYVGEWRRPGRLGAMLNYYRALRLPGESPGRIAVPTLILWGAKDSFLDNRLAHRSAALCEVASVAVLAGFTHWLHHEAPQQVTEHILAFIGNK